MVYSIDIDLKNKSKNLGLLCQQMTADISQRPNCDQILSAKKEWSLSRSDLISDLSIDSIMKLVSQIFFETESLENCFIKRFIKLKFNI
jgi:hypothetical protein